MKPRLNIMHLVWSLDRAGMEKGVFNICHRLPPDQFATSICALDPGGALESQVDPQRVTMLHVRRHFGNDPTVPLRLARQLRRLRIDVLHTHNCVTLVEGLIAAKLARTPVVIHGEHGKIQDRQRQILVQRWAWRRADRVLSVSNALADRMADRIGFPRDRIQVIPNGVDTGRFRPSDAPNGELRRELGISASGFLLGMVARFVEFKDHAGVFRALAQLREAGIEAHLALAGSGPLQDELGRLADELRIVDRVHFLGELNPVEPLLHALDVLVSNSSHNEGMSNAVLEAMACAALPVILLRSLTKTPVWKEWKPEPRYQLGGSR
ncbi:hypothetical protein LCGC14_2258800 [marine sediment metagenome]|uniref:Glycosyltransferase subfamily 4-like N-terminal domain-containing protein n=1 Tax=marine sediment metagenome TaxID=412755 RepID=A0A0F9D0M1_9ZZZZ